MVRSSSRRDNLEEAQDDQTLPDLEEPLPECSLSFTHGIGNQVSNSIKSVLQFYFNSFFIDYLRAVLYKQELDYAS